MGGIQLGDGRRLQIRAVSLFGPRGHVTAVSEATGYTPEYISRLFNERLPLTDEATSRIEAFLEEAEAAHESKAA